MASYKNTVENLSSGLGITIDEEDDAITLDAPVGMVFDLNGLHFVVEARWNAQERSRADMWRTHVENIRFGLSECAERECETCYSSALNSLALRSGMFPA